MNNLINELIRQNLSKSGKGGPSSTNTRDRASSEKNSSANYSTNNSSSQNKYNQQSTNYQSNPICKQIKLIQYRVCKDI